MWFKVIYDSVLILTSLMSYLCLAYNITCLTYAMSVFMKVNILIYNEFILHFVIIVYYSNFYVTVLHFCS